MVGFRPGIARCRRLPGRVSGLAIATGLLVAACAPAQTNSTGTAAAHTTAKPSSSASPPRTSSADCATTCYTPQQLEVAYGVQPLLRRGIDGRGETVVLPELAETQLNPPVVTDLRQDFAAYDRLYHLPAPRLKVVSTFPGPTHPWLAFGEEVLDAEVVHAIAPRAALTIVLVQGTSLDSPFHDVTAGSSNTAEFPPTTITGYRPGPGWDRLPAGAAPTPRSSSRCSPSMPPHDSPGRRGVSEARLVPWEVARPAAECGAQRGSADVPHVVGDVDRDSGGNDLVDAVEQIGWQLDPVGGEVAVQVLHRARADDRGGDRRMASDECDRHLDEGDPGLVGERAEGIGGSSFAALAGLVAS